MKIVFGLLGLGVKEIETQTVPSAAQDEFSSTFGSSWSYGFLIINSKFKGGSFFDL